MKPHCIIANTNCVVSVLELLNSYERAPYGTNPYRYEEEHKIIIVTDKDITKEFYKKLKNIYYIDFVFENSLDKINMCKKLGLVVLQNG